MEDERYLDKANNMIIYPALLLILSISTYLVPLILKFKFDFGLIFELLGLVFLFVTKYFIKEKEVSKAKTNLLISAFFIAFILTYDLIVFIYNVSDIINLASYLTSFIIGELALGFYLVFLYKINKELNKLINPKIYNDDQNIFYKDMTNSEIKKRYEEKDLNYIKYNGISRETLMFIYSLMCILSIIIPGPIVSVINLCIFIPCIIRIYKIVMRNQKAAKDFKVILIVLIIASLIDFTVIYFKVNNKNNLDNINSISNEAELSPKQIGETAILIFKMKNLDLFSSNLDYKDEIKDKFENFLLEELSMIEVQSDSDNICCEIGGETLIFKIKKNDIKCITK